MSRSRSPGHKADATHLIPISPDARMFWEQCYLEDKNEGGESIFEGSEPWPQELLQDPCPSCGPRANRWAGESDRAHNLEFNYWLTRLHLREDAFRTSIQHKWEEFIDILREDLLLVVMTPTEVVTPPATMLVDDCRPGVSTNTT